MKKFTLITLSIGLLFFFNSCRIHKNTSLSKVLSESTCNQNNVYNHSNSTQVQPLDEITIDPELKNNLSTNTLHLANALGLLETLNKYVTLKSNKDTSVQNLLKLYSVKQEIFQKIHNASLIVSAVSSELDCEEERTSQIANYLEGKRDELESKLTITAIVVGASGAIATGGTIKNEKLSNTIGISTGITEAALGFMMLFNKRSIEFMHKRNALQEIWEGGVTSKIFPPFIWYYLNYKKDFKYEQKTLRQEIIEKWTNTGQLDLSKDGQASIKLYFGQGGKYSIDQLKNRADMYDQLESHINLLKQELMQLSNKIETL